jgi:hypothetical protein
MSLCQCAARLAASLIGLMVATVGGSAGANGQQAETAPKDVQASLGKAWGRSREGMGSIVYSCISGGNTRIRD